MPKKPKKTASPKKSPAKRAPPKKRAAKPSAANPSPAKKQSAYLLTAARQTALEAEAESVTDDVIAFPGRLDQRVRWSTKIRLAAQRDAADLIRAPFHRAPKITPAEIAGQRDRIEFLRLTESRFQAIRSRQQTAVTDFDRLAEEAGGHKETLLRTFDLRFQNDPDGQKRLSAIRAGSGDADLVQDVSDLIVLCDEHADYLADCPRGEAQAAARLKKLSPELIELLAKKGMSADAQRARRLRDAAYTLVIRTERRLRAAADYWYRGTDRMKDYAIFPAPAAAPAETTEEPDETPDDGDATEGDASEGADDTAEPDAPEPEPAAENDAAPAAKPKP